MNHRSTDAVNVRGDLHIEWVEDEAVVLDTRSGELHYLNPQAALVFALLQEHGLEQAKRELTERFGSNSDFEEELSGLLEDMTNRGLLVDD